MHFYEDMLVLASRRRFLIVLRPCGVAIRVLKPDTFKIEYRLLFESVRFAIVELNEK